MTTLIYLIVSAALAVGPDDVVSNTVQATVSEPGAIISISKLNDWTGAPNGFVVGCRTSDGHQATFMVGHESKHRRAQDGWSPHGSLLVYDLEPGEHTGQCRMIDARGTELRLDYRVNRDDTLGIRLPIMAEVSR